MKKNELQLNISCTTLYFEVFHVQGHSGKVPLQETWQPKAVNGENMFGHLKGFS